jgi:hypothetical protein
MPVETAHASPLKTFNAVLTTELEYISKRRLAAGPQPAREHTASADSVRDDLWGLSLSGGGIRSAIFSLGVLQAMQERGTFARFDYISSVSGGGYIATCLSILTRKPRTAFPLAPHDKAVRWLRDRSQYLSRTALWLRLGSTLLLGLVVNLLTLAPALAAAVFIIALYGRFRLPEFFIPLAVPSWDPLLLLGALLLLVAARGLLDSLARMLFWPFVMQAEMATKTTDVPANTRARVERYARLVGTMASAMPGWIGSMLADLGEIARAILDKDWRRLHQESYGAREAFRHRLDLLIVALLIFAFLEAQPIMLRWVHAGPAFAPALSSLEFWTGIITLAGALASVATVAGTGGLGVLTRIVPLVAAVLGPVGVYLACLLAAEWTLSYIPRHAWTWSTVVDAITWGAAPQQLEQLVLAAVLLLVGYWLVPWVLFDLNDRSIHGFYRDSLSGTFVIDESSAGKIEALGDVKLSDVNQPDSSSPYHLINATLNLQAEPALRNTGRNGDAFILTRDVYGSDRTGYASTARLEAAYGSFTAASAMAVSGAAASPQMGIFTRRPLVFIMSILNIRLGCWLPNPAARMRLFWRPNPLWLFREMLSRLDAKRRGIYVSDGGHFENTGMYQLLKRRCRVIVAVDATTDASMTFDGLADLKRYARVDLNVEIDIDVAPMKLDGDGVCRTHCVVGRIRYPTTQTLAASEGILFLVKSSLTGDEDVEIQSYKSRAPHFPHEPLSDQFFDEGQFEAYSRLGHHAAASLLDSTVFTSVADAALIS